MVNRPRTHPRKRQSDPANFVDHVNSLQQFSKFRALARTLAFFDRDVALAIFFVAPANRRNDLSLCPLPNPVAVDRGLVDHHFQRRESFPFPGHRGWHFGPKSSSALKAVYEPG